MKNTTRLFVVAMILMAVIALCVGCNVTGNTKETEAPTAEQTDVKATEAPTEEPTEKATTDDTEPTETEEATTVEQATEAPTEEPEDTEVVTSYSDWTIEDEPTCTLEGTQTRTITYEYYGVRTGKVYNTTTDTEMQPIPANGHGYCERNDIAATCKQTGLTAEKCCPFCGEIFEASVTTPIDPANHNNPLDIPAVPATCKEAGKTAGVRCADCGAIITAQETIPATGAHEIEVVPASAATCSECGKTEGQRCKLCGDWIVAPADTDEQATGHDWHWFKCSKCGEDQTSKGLEYQELVPGRYTVDNYTYQLNRFGYDLGYELGEAYYGCVVCIGRGTCTDRNIVIPEYDEQGRRVVAVLGATSNKSFDNGFDNHEFDAVYLPSTIIVQGGCMGGILDDAGWDIVEYLDVYVADGIVWVPDEDMYHIHSSANGDIIPTHFE